MKLFTTQKILKPAGFTVLLALTSLIALSQGQTSIGYGLSSCYHELVPTNTGQTINVLNHGEFEFTYTNNAGAKPDFFRMRLYNTDGLYIGYDYEQIGITDGLFNVTNHPQYGVLVAAQKYDESTNKWLTNKNKFVFPEHVGRVEITAYHWTGTDGDYTIDPTNYSIDMNLLTVDEAFIPQSKNNQCLTFNNFNLEIAHQLSGFCGTLVNPVMTPAEPIPSGSGFTPDYVQNVVFGERILLNQPHTDQGVPWCQDERNQVMADRNAPHPVPNGCIEFELKYEMEPCSTADINCPTIEIIQPISVCCSCDVRQLGPSN